MRHTVWLLALSLIPACGPKLTFNATRYFELEGRIRTGDAKGFANDLKDDDVYVCNDLRQTLLMAAAEQGNVEIAKLLIDRGAGVNVKDNMTRMTPLDLALERSKNADIAVLLLKHGAKPTRHAAPPHVTSLMTAAMNNLAKAIPALVDAGSDVAARDDLGMTPLHWAAQQGSTAAALELVKVDSDVDRPVKQKGKLGVSALMLAAVGGHADTMEVLIDHGADVKAKTPLGDSPIMLAGMSGNVDAIQLLLDHGASPTEVGPEGITMLMATALSCDAAAVDLMLAKGGDPRAVNADGKTAADIAEGHSAQAAGEARKTEADPNRDDARLKTMLTDERTTAVKCAAVAAMLRARTPD